MITNLIYCKVVKEKMIETKLKLIIAPPYAK